MANTIVSLNQFPNELVERFLCDNNKDRHYLLMLVCRRWRDIIKRWRMYNNLPTNTLSPLSLCVESETLFDFVHKESWYSKNFGFSSKSNYYCMLKQLALSGQKNFFVEKIRKVPDMFYELHDEVTSMLRSVNTKNTSILDQCINYTDPIHRGLLSYIGRGGNVDLFNWLNNADALKLNMNIFIPLVSWSIEKGLIEPFLWLVAHKNFDKMDFEQLIMTCLYSASINGHKDIFDHINNTYTAVYVIKPRCLTLAIRTAENGHLDMVKYLYENDYPKIRTTQMCLTVIKKGRVNIIDWLYNYHHESIDWERLNINTNAVYHKQLEVLKWGYSKWDNTHNTRAFALNGNILYQAADVKGNDDVVKWLFSIGCSYSEYQMQAFARNNSIEMICWGRDNNLPFDEGLCIEAARSDNLPLLKWLREHDYPWNAEVCEAAVEYQSFSILKWAHENGCDWDESSILEAISNSNMSMFQYLLENNCPYNYENVYSSAQQFCEYEMLQYLHEMRYPDKTGVTLFDVY